MKEHEDQVLRLLTQVVHRLTAQIETFAFEGTKFRQGIFIIDYITHHDQCSMSDVIREMKMTPSTATRQVDRLVERNFVVRNSSKQDRRRVILSLTEKGKRAYESFFNHRMKTIQPVLHSMNEKETKVLINLLERVNERL